MIALALGHHNGAGQWPNEDIDRWSSLGIPLAPWRTSGERLLVLLQRGIGEPGVAMPHDWGERIVARLRAVTSRLIVVRKHPGMHEPDSEPDFTNIHAAVTWASGAAIKAIVAGIPVFYEFKNWIGADAAKFGLTDLEQPYLSDRLPMLKRLAQAQWSVDEIGSGEAFARLLDL